MLGGKKQHTHIHDLMSEVVSEPHTWWHMSVITALRTEPGGFQIWSQPAHSKFEARWGYIMKSLQTNKEEKMERKKYERGERRQRKRRKRQWRLLWQVTGKTRPAFPTSQQFSLYVCKYKAVPWQHKLCSAPRFIWAFTSIWDWGCQQPFTDSTVTTLYLNVREITVSQRFGIWRTKWVKARNKQSD